MKKFFLLWVLCVMLVNVWAIPARRGGVMITQPDGSEIMVYQHGDEYFHWMTNEKGEWLIKDANGSYQVTDSLSTEKIIARRKNAPRQKENVGTLNLSPRGLVILVNYQDVSFTTSADEMYNMLMGKNYSRDYTYVRSNKTYVVKSEGSAQKYFYDASNGQYQPEFDIVGPVTLSQNMAYYGANDGNGNDVHPALMVAEACELVNGSVDFTQYDNDNDGVVDFVYVYYAGYGEADGGDANTIWPHAWQVSAEKQLKLDGKKIDVYACSNELDYTTKAHSGIGTFCHEFSHVLGLPDLYATNGASHKTLDSWDIMDYGNYNNEGNTPPTYSAYERFYMGWLTPRLIVESENVVLDELQNSNSALLISTTDNHNLVGTNPSPTTFYILENRQQKAWDEFLPWSGMMLTKIQYNSNKWYNNVVNNTASSMGVDLIEADGITDKTKAGDLFPAGATEYLGIDNHPIKNIRDKNGVITFSYKNAIPDEEEEQDEYKDYIRVTDITTLKDYDRVVLYCDGNAVGVTGWNGSRDALVAESGWVEFVVETTDDGVYLKDMSACAYIASPGTSNQFVYGTKAVCNVNEDGVLTCNNRYFVANGTYYRMYTNINSYDPFYVYKVIPRNENELTYNVTVPVGTNACYIAGDMNGWTFTEMNKVDATHYTITLQDATTTMEYKYCSGPSWDYGERAGNNRKYSISDIVEEWAAVYNPEIDNEGSELKEITVKAHVPASWTDQITAWVWHTGGDGREVVPTKDGDWYVVTENCAELNIIYKNGAGWNGDVNQTMDMTFSENTCIDITANAGTLATYTIVDCIDTDSASGVIFDPEVDKGNASSDSNSAAAYSVTKNGVTMNVSTGIVGTTNNITHYRIYKGQTLTLSSTVGNIVSVEFSCTSTGDYGPAGFTTTIGTYDYLDATGTWTGNASKIVFTATNNQVRASKITVTLESDSLPTQEVVDCIYYTSTDGNIVTPYATDVFGANIISNTYENGQGVITFDGPVTSIGYRAFNACMTLKSIIIPNSVTTIGERAFNICDNLTAITIGRGVTSIDARAFQPVRLTSIVVDAENPTYDSRDNCNAIIETATNTLIQGCQKTVIAQSVTHIGEWAFEFCEYLSSITIPNSVISIGENAFNNCKSLTSVTIPNSVTSIGLAAFSSCDKLTSMVVDTANPVYDSRENCNAIIETSTNTLIAGCSNTIIPQSIIHIGEYAFSSCNISSITIPNSVTTIGKYAFAYSDIASITIPNSVTTIGEYAFNTCSSLTSVTIPNSVKDIKRWVFANCSSLNSITLHDGITTIGEGAFINCSSLTSVIIPNSVTSIRTGAFSFCKSLTSIVVDSGNTTYDSRENCNAIIETGSNTLIAGCQNTIIPNGITKIYLEAFMGCSSLTAITIPNSVTRIGGWAFNGCSLLDTIYVEATTPPTLEYNNVFTGTPSPTCIVPCGTLAAYQASDWANQVGELVEEECEETKEIIVKARVPASWTDSIFVWVWPTGGEGVELIPEKQDDWYVFTQKGEELNIIFKNGRGWIGYPYQTEDITLTESACLQIYTDNNEYLKATYTFIDCNSVNPNHQILYTSLDGKIVTPFAADVFGADIISNTYENGHGVITFDGPVTSIGDYAFNECNQLWTITLPESVTRIGNSAFDQCVMLSSINLPESIISIGSQAFFYCIALNEIIIPKSVTSIEYGTFNQCSSLRTITIHENITSIGNQAFERCSYLDTIYVEATIPPTLGSYAFDNRSSVCFVPCGTLTAYQTSDWGLQLTNIDDQCSFQILYTSSDDNIVTPTSSATFGANIVSNTYENGQGVITFDGPVTKIGAEAFSYCKTLTSIVIPKYVNTIEYYAFSGCDALAEISVQEGNMAYDSREYCNAVIETATNTLVVGCKNTIFPSSVTCIGDFAFRANQSLTTIRIPEGITSIGTETFCACQSLSCIVLPETLNSIGLWAFYGCSSLTSIDIPKGVTTISEKAFKDCSSVDTINVYAENPPILGYEAFAGTPSPTCIVPCGTLAPYQASDWATQVGELVEDCEDLSPTNQIQYTTFDESILTIDTTYYTYEDLFGANIISNTYENGVGTITFDRPLTTIGNNAFGGSGYYLTSIKLPNTVTSIGSGAFWGCYYLTEFTIPENVTTIGRDAFSSCEALTEITIPKSVTSIEPQIFNRCPSLIKITIEEGNETYDSRDNCNAIIETATNKLIEGCKTTIIPNTVTSIGESAFSGCENLSSITIPNSVTSIEVWAFASCYALDAVFIDAIMPPTLIYNYTLYKYQVFSGKYPTCYVPCGTLAAYQASDWAKEGVTLLEKPCENTIPTNQIQYTSSDGNVITPNIGYMTEFDAFGANIVSNTYENGVGTITFDGAVSRIGYQSFSNSETLTSITLPDSISTIDFEAFRNCDRLKFVTIPNSVYGIWDYAFGECDSLVAVNIPASVEYIGSNAFNGCYQLASVEISEGLWQIGDYAFSGCSKLTSLSLPSTLQYLGQSAFSGCGFSTFTIPTGLTTIPAYLFMYCQNLQSVTIPENITAIEDGAFSTCLKLTSIDIPNSVTSIGFGAFSETRIRSIVLPENITTINGNTFYGCTNLTSITIPNKVTTIKESAFSGCTSLKSVSIPNSVTTIEGNVFYDCTSLEELYIPKSVTSISNYAFSNCESLKSIMVEDGNTVYDSRNNCNAIIETATNTLITGCQNTIIPKNVVNVGKYAFKGQKQLNLIAFPNSVQKIEYNAFADCSNLKTILFGNQVDSIAQRAFENCLAIDDIYSYSLQPPVLSENALAYYDANLYVPCSALADYQVADKWNQFTYVQCIDTMYFNITNDTVRPYTVEVTYGDILYAGDVFIPALVMIDDEVYNVTNIGDSAFYDCSSLTSVSIPESVVSVDPNAFTNCTSLDTITIKATTPPTLDNSGISSNPVCKIPCHTQSVYEASNWNNHVKNFEEQCDGYYIYYTSTDGNVVRPYKTDVFNAKIVSNSYEHGVGIIAFDKPVRRIGEMAFTDCRKLSSITIPNTVLIIDDKAFFRCSSLVDITLPNSVKIIGSSAFYDCSSLTSITIPNSVTSIGGYAFGYCSSITSMVVPNSVTTIGKNAFANCKALTSINIPNTITKLEDGVFEFCTSMTSIVIPNSIASIGKSAFSHCTSLSAINIPNSVVYLGSSVFSSCTSLTSFTIPNSIDTLARSLFTGCTSLSTIHIPNSVTVIDNQAFSDCSSLTAVTIGENVISIGGWAFDNCSSLISITIPNSVTNIGKYAFSDCDTLKTVYVEATVPPTLSGNIFSNTTPPTCHIPCGTLAAYQASDWANQVGELVEDCATEDLIPTNQIQYTTWDDEIVRMDTTSHIDYNNAEVNYYSMFGANIISNTYENGVGTITFDAPVTVIGRDVFNNSNLRTIILPNSISTIETNAFADCSSLQTITLPRNLRSIGYGAFRMCSQLQSIEFPEGLESIEGRAFENCFNGMGYYATGGSFMEPNEGYIGYGLSISIPSSVTSIGEGVFAWCSGITSIVVDDNNTIYDSRENCNAIIETATNTMIAGCRNSFIPNSVTVLGYGVFYGHSIKSINIPNGVVSIGESAFAYSSIETLHVPGSVKTIGRDAFDHCGELTTLTLSEGLETIEYAGIYCCFALKSIVFPSTLKSIGGYGVSACSSMTSVEFLSTTPPTINNDFYGCFWDTPCEFTVPCGTKDAYYTALNADAPSGYHIESTRIREKGSYVYSITSSSEAQGTVTITDDATCDNLTISFRADAASGYRFARWSDNVTDNPRTLTLYQDTILRADFMEYSETNLTLCESELPYLWYNHSLTETGKYTHSEQYAGTDIDSIYHILDLIVVPTDHTTEQVTICYGDTYTWNGQTYATAGAYSITLQNANGCDSIVTLHLTVLPEVPVTIETATIYDGEEYIWHDESYFEEGEYSITLQNINGCDSVITLILTVLPIYENEWSLLQEIRDDLIQNNAWQTPWDLSTSVSSWPGVELYKGHVIEIDLSSQGLTGTFPTKILQMPHLEYLSLADNLLTGEAFAKMQTDMTTFVAENPTFLSALIYLDISYNQFTGNVGIIAAMSNFMPNLSFLQANNNRFRDVIPVIPQKINVDLSEQDINHYVHMDASELNIDPTQLPTIMLYDHVGQTYFTSPIAVDITNYSPDYTYSHDNPWGIMIDKTNDYMLCLNGDAYRGKNGDTLYLSYPYSEVSHYSYCRMTLSFEMGDANFVDGVNIADLQTTILYAFGEYNDCVFNFTAADTYTDNKINVQDVIRTVGILVANAINNTDSIMMNHIAPREQQSSADAEIFVDNNAIKVVTTRPIAALQINFKGNAQWKMNDLGMEQTATQHTVVAYSLTGNNIPVGETIIGYCQGNVDLLHAELSDADARLIPVTISGQRMPTATEDLQTTDNEQAIYDVLGRKHNQINQQGLYIIKSNNQYIKVFNYNK